MALHSLSLCLVATGELSNSLLLSRVVKSVGSVQSELQTVHDTILFVLVLSGGDCL